MIANFNLETMKINQVCDKCKTSNEYDIQKQELLYLEEFKEYQNYMLPACECGTVEVLNMNLPENEEDIRHLMSEEEWRIRCFIKSLKEYCVEDLEEFPNNINKIE